MGREQIIFKGNIAASRGQSSGRTIVREDNRQGGQSSGRTNIRGTFVRETFIQMNHWKGFDL